MDENTTTSEGLKDTARMHAQRDEVRAGLPLLFSMAVMGLLGALGARIVLDGGIVEWIAIVGVFAVTAHATGVVYGIAHSKVRGVGDD